MGGTEGNRRQVGPERKEPAHQGGIAQAVEQLVDAANGDPLQAQHRVQDHVDPKHRVHSRHHKEGRDQKHPHYTLAREGLVDQHRDQHAQKDGQKQDATNNEQAVLDGKQEVFGVENKLIIPKAAPVAQARACPLRAAQIVQHVADKGEVQGHSQGNEHPHQ